QQPVRHRPSAVGNEPKRNARRPCMITQRLGAEEVRSLLCGCRAALAGSFRATMPSCLISCSHWLPEGSLSVLVGRHGAMNPARSGTRQQAGLNAGSYQKLPFSRAKPPVFPPPASVPDAPRWRGGKPRPAAKTSPRRVGALTLDMPVVSAQKERPRPVEARDLRWIRMRHVSLRPHPTVSQLGSRDVGEPWPFGDTASSGRFALADLCRGI